MDCVFDELPQIWTGDLSPFDYFVARGFLELIGISHIGDDRKSEHPQSQSHGESNFGDR